MNIICFLFILLFININIIYGAEIIGDKNEFTSNDICIKYDNITRTIILCDGSANPQIIYSYFNDSSIIEKIKEKEYVLKSNIQILENSTLYIDSGNVKWLKIDLNKENGYSITSKGNLIINNTKITSWNSSINSIPNILVPEIPRGYILTFWNAKGHTNITNSYFEGLGYQKFIGTEGITFFAGDGSTVKNNTIINNYIGINIPKDVEKIKINYNNITKSLKNGINMESKANTISVFGNNINENNLHGISCTKNCHNIEIQNNILRGNVGTGIYMDKGSNNISIIDNNAQKNSIGIMSADSFDIKIIENTLYDNSNGIFIKKSWNNTIDKNDINNSRNFGVNIFEGAKNNWISSNNILGSLDNGINIKDSGTTENYLIMNKITDGVKYGILLENNKKNTFENNEIHGNGNGDYRIIKSQDNIIKDTIFNQTSFVFDDTNSDLTIENKDNRAVEGNIELINSLHSNKNIINLIPQKNQIKLQSLELFVVPSYGHINISNINHDFSTNKNFKKWNAKFSEQQIETEFKIGGFNINDQILATANKSSINISTVDENKNIIFTFKNNELNYRFELQTTNYPLLITIGTLIFLLIATTTIFIVRKKRKKNSIQKV
ncbi:MAG: right-handed parallel beta-helix repeat-containing protein [Nitrososphaeraceae archaeon]